MEDNFKEIVEEALSKDIDRLEYFTRLQKFHDEHCCSCDNEFCNWIEGLPYAKELIICE